MGEQMPSTSKSANQNNTSNTRPKKHHKFNQKKGLTPYQGNNQCFGYFKCEKCRNEWESDCSSADKWLPCEKCRAKVYPHKQVNSNVEFLDS